jgi:2-polyprenyl-3-methyl-5-hydroxy-6-metoxy-1,4-benzoquinol methylase
MESHRVFRHMSNQPVAAAPPRATGHEEPGPIESNGTGVAPVTPGLPPQAVLPAPGAPRRERTREASPAVMSTSCVVRARDFRKPWFAARARELGHPLMVHRKLWEFCVIAQVGLENIGPGARALGFGVGLEPLAAWLASRGANVVATDRPDETLEWDHTNQHAVGLEQLRHPGVCPDAEFDERVRFMPVDMNQVPDELCRGDFDFTWSAGSFEHIGGIDRGLDFFCRQMACLRPGGLAVHTTEFNMFSYQPTMEEPNLVLFRVQELQVLAERLAAQGDSLWPMDLASGTEPDDLYIDSPPYRLPHLKLALGPFTTTSVLLVARRGGA